jgi:AraC-like DNA-binding protein/ligand-binding sensor protein
MDKRSTNRSYSKNPLVEALARSQMYLDYQCAFTQGTGLPLVLQEPDRVHLVQFGRSAKTPFCVLVAKASKACAACYAVQQQLEREAKLEPRTLRCFAGLCESAIPVRVAENLIAFLHTGQVLLHPPTKSGFNRVAAALLKWGAKVDLKSLEDAYFQTRVLRPAQYQSLIWLLGIFAGHLAACGNELLLRTQEREPPVVAKARAFLSANYTEVMTRAQVARAVNSSATYFSKRFKETTGMSFIDYTGRVRVEQAKNLLQNPSLRISNIAFEIGFQSVSQFNRTFKRVTGRSPKKFRAR